MFLSCILESDRSYRYPCIERLLCLSLFHKLSSTDKSDSLYVHMSLLRLRVSLRCLSSFHSIRLTFR